MFFKTIIDESEKVIKNAKYENVTINTIYCCRVNLIGPLVNRIEITAKKYPGIVEDR